MKQMACVISDEEVIMRCICSVCGKVHFIGEYSDIYFDYANNGPSPFVGKYPGWDDAFEVNCDACYERAVELFGEDLVLPLLKSGELPMAEFFMTVALGIEY